MEINAANVAWHNFFFFGKPSFVSKKMDEKKNHMFAELCTEEIKEITDNAVPVTTTTKKIGSR